MKSNRNQQEITQKVLKQSTNQQEITYKSTNQL